MGAVGRSRRAGRKRDSVWPAASPTEVDRQHHLDAPARREAGHASPHTRPRRIASAGSIAGRKRRHPVRPLSCRSLEIGANRLSGAVAPAKQVEVPGSPVRAVRPRSIAPFSMLVARRGPARRRRPPDEDPLVASPVTRRPPAQESRVRHGPAGSTPPAEDRARPVPVTADHSPSARTACSLVLRVPSPSAPINYTAGLPASPWRPGPAAARAGAGFARRAPRTHGRAERGRGRWPHHVGGHGQLPDPRGGEAEWPIAGRR